MIKAVEARAIPHHKLLIKFSDGLEGEVDLSHLAGKGVFKLWNNHEDFEKVEIGSSGQLSWGEDIEICSDSLYLRIRGCSAEELFEDLVQEPVIAGD